MKFNKISYMHADHSIGNQPLLLIPAVLIARSFRTSSKMLWLLPTLINHLISSLPYQFNQLKRVKTSPVFVPSLYWLAIFLENKSPFVLAIFSGFSSMFIYNTGTNTTLEQRESIPTSQNVTGFWKITHMGANDTVNI